MFNADDKFPADLILLNDKSLMVGFFVRFEASYLCRDFPTSWETVLLQ